MELKDAYTRIDNFCCSNHNLYYPLIKYAQHNYCEHASAITILHVFIEAIVKNLKDYMTETEE